MCSDFLRGIKKDHWEETEAAPRGVNEASVTSGFFAKYLISPNEWRLIICFKTTFFTSCDTTVILRTKFWKNVQ